MPHEIFQWNLCGVIFSNYRALKKLIILAQRTQHLVLLFILLFFQANWRWLCDGNHDVRKEDRQHLLRKFKEMVYAKTKKEFLEKQDEFGECETCAKYPRYKKHLENTYGGRVETWALYHRIEHELPTHGNNTTAYAEVSMKATKETQFGRVKTRNLPEMLSVICDNSTLYKDKLIEIGNNRAAVLKRARSKYIGPESKTTKDQIADLGEGVFMVESEKHDDIMYTCNMKTGYCSCPKGVNCAPCKHKSSVSINFDTAEFSVVPTNDPRQCALYHYIATGFTLEAHMYRKRGDMQTVPDIQKFIDDKLSPNIDTLSNQSMLEDDSAIISIENTEVFENESESDDETEEEREAVHSAYLKSLQDYHSRAVAMSNADTTPGMVKAMKAMTKTLNKSKNCNILTIESQMHMFGKGTSAARKTKTGQVITPNPPALSRRLAAGSAPAPLGRRHKDRSGETAVVESTNGPVLARSDNPPLYPSRRRHDFRSNVDENLPGPRH
jgi:hypothetical protein